ncbi:MAG: hypothetical protein KAT32_05020 [Candidatus Moranbacteria bacterium]|nr:hypothetical protein [Candidatus Moranbacteria bacterium]
MGNGKLHVLEFSATEGNCDKVVEEEKNSIIANLPKKVIFLLKLLVWKLNIK